MGEALEEDTAEGGLDDGGEDDGDDGHELDENVEGGARGVLEGITDGVTDDGSGVLGSTLTLATSGLEATGFDVLLGVVPGTTSVGGRDGHLDTGDEGTGEETGEGVLAEEDTADDGAEDDEDTGGDHLAEGTFGGDGDALLVVGFLSTVGDLGVAELTADFVDHSHGSGTDGLHGHGGEPVGEHSTDDETGEDTFVEDVDGLDLGAGDVGTIEGETDEGGGADGETLADGGGGVTGGVEGVSDVTDFGTHFGHFGNAPGVVGDGAVGVDGEGDGHGGEHAEGGEGVAEETAHVVGEEDGDGHGGGGGEDGDVAEGETVDDVGGGTGFAGFGDFLDGPVGAGGVVFGGVADEETRPETGVDADEGGGAGGVDGADGEGFGEAVHGDEVEDDGGTNGGHDELLLEDGFDVFGLLDAAGDGGEVGGDHADDGAGGGDHEGVHHVSEVGGEFSGGGSNDEGGAGGFTEGAEQVGAHTGDITNVVTDAVSNDTGVALVIFRDVLFDLADEISTDVGSLGEDTTTNTAEAGDGGATETEGGDAFVELLGVGGEGGVGEADGDEEGEDAEGGEAEAHGDTTTEGGFEGSGVALFVFLLVSTISGHDGSAAVGEDGDAHTDPAGEDGGAGAHEEGEDGEASVGPGSFGDDFFGVSGVGEGDTEEDVEEDTEGAHEDGHVAVFGEEEGSGTIGDTLGDGLDVDHDFVSEEGRGGGESLAGFDDDFFGDLPPVHTEGEGDDGAEEDDAGGGVGLGGSVHGDENEGDDDGGGSTDVDHVDGGLVFLGFSFGFFAFNFNGRALSLGGDFGFELSNTLLKFFFSGHVFCGYDLQKKEKMIYIILKKND